MAESKGRDDAVLRIIVGGILLVLGGGFVYGTRDPVLGDAPDYSLAFMALLGIVLGLVGLALFAVGCAAKGAGLALREHNRTS